MSLDTNGDGSPETSVALAALGVSADELSHLAALYQAGQTLWRVPVPHFSAWDFNYAFGCEADSDGKACAPPEGDDPVIAGRPEPESDTECGSIIECENQALGEDVDVVGTPFQLSYRSMRQLGRKAERRVTIRPPTKVSSKALGFVYEVTVAGQRLRQRLPVDEKGLVTFVWDGRDAFGRPHHGAAPVIVRTGFLYRPVYAAAAAASGGRSFASGGTGSAFVGAARFCSGTCPDFNEYQYGGLLVAWKTWTGTLASWTALPTGLGGWTLSAHHAYDPVAKLVQRGDGTTQAASPVDSHVITTVAPMPWSTGIAAGPDGSIFAVSGWSSVNRIDPSGAVTRVAGGGSCTAPQSGIPATQACFGWAFNVSLGPDGSLYVPDRSSRASPVRRIRPDGVIEDFAGHWHDRDMSTVPIGDGGPALQARIGIAASIAPAPDGSVYILGDDRIRKVTPDGIIHAFAGTGAACCQHGSCSSCCNTGDDGPALSAQICGGGNYGQIALGPDGSVYVTDTVHGVVRRVRPDGIIERVAGNGTSYQFSGDGGQATLAQIGRASGLSVASDGSLYIADDYNWRIRRVSPAGVIETVAGSGPAADGQPRYTGDGGPAVAAKIYGPHQAVVGPAGDLFIADTDNYVVRRVGAPLPGFTLAEFTIASQGGGELYVFGTSGRHLRTLDARTRAVLYSFAYDAAGRLASVTDRHGLVTRIERSGDAPAAIVAPHGQRTALSVDGNGYLSAISNPAGETRSYGYDADGLMRTFTDPRSYVHTFLYDELGRLYRDEDPGGGFKQLTRTNGADGYSVAVTTALGRSTVHGITRLGTSSEVRTLVKPDGTALTRTSYSNGNRDIAWPDGTAGSFTFGPDPQFGMQSPLQPSTRIATPSGVVQTLAQTASITLARSGRRPERQDADRPAHRERPDVPYHVRCSLPNAHRDQRGREKDGRHARRDWPAGYAATARRAGGHLRPRCERATPHGRAGAAGDDDRLRCGGASVAHHGRGRTPGAAAP